jgi:hypothetical protein
MYKFFIVVVYLNYIIVKCLIEASLLQACPLLPLEQRRPASQLHACLALITASEVFSTSNSRCCRFVSRRATWTDQCAYSCMLSDLRWHAFMHRKHDDAGFRRQGISLASRQILSLKHRPHPHSRQRRARLLQSPHHWPPVRHVARSSDCEPQGLDPAQH